MAETETTHPPGPTLAELYTQLADLQAQRDQIIAKPSGARDLVLFELVALRGMSTVEAGALIGISRQAVNKQVEPLREQFGIPATASWVEARARARQVPRPYRDVSDLALARLLADADWKRESGRAARSLLADMKSTVAQLTEWGETIEGMAERLGVGTTTISRLRGSRT